MNFHKGGRIGGKREQRTGKAGSFKKALQYYLHDKRPEDDNGPHPLTSDRVGFVVMENLPDIPPGEAWKEMKFIADAAGYHKEQTAREKAQERGDSPEDIEAAAAATRRGRKTTEPGYVYSLQWHPDDFAGMEPDERDRRMIEAARETLRLLGLADRHAVIIQHTDQPHPHVHIIANRIDMHTGAANEMKDDEDILRFWCFEQEVKAGIIRSPNHYEHGMARLQREDPTRFAAILAMKLPGAPSLGLEQPQAQPDTERRKRAPRERKPRNHQSRDEWAARKGASTGNAASIAATKIKRDTAQAYREMKARQQAAYDRRKVESAAAWNQYQDEKRKIMAAYKPQIDRFYAKPAKRGTLSALQRVKAFWNAPGDTIRQEQERKQWQRMGRAQWEERRDFEARERTMLGRLANAARYSRLAAAEQGRGQLSAGFTLLSTKAERQRLFEMRQEQARASLRDRQRAAKKKLADPVRARRDIDLKRAAEAFEARKAAIARAHVVEQAKEKAERLALSTTRNNAWQQWRGQFGIKAQTRYAFNDAAGRRSPEPRTAFNQVAPPEAAPEQDNRKTTGGKGRRTFSAFATEAPDEARQKVERGEAARPSDAFKDAAPPAEQEQAPETPPRRAFTAFDKAARGEDRGRDTGQDRGREIPPPGSDRQ